MGSDLKIVILNRKVNGFLQRHENGKIETTANKGIRDDKRKEHDFMQQLSTYVPPTENLSFAQRLKAVRTAGFDSVCLDWEEEAIAADGDRREQLKKAQALGLAVEHVHLTGSHTNEMWLEGEKGEHVTERYRKELKLCAECGIRTAVVHVTWGTLDTPPVTAIGLERFGRLAGYAEFYHVQAALENSVSMAHLDALLEHLKNPWVGLCFDSGHCNCFTPAADPLGRWGDRLFAMHLHDNDGTGDWHSLPFDGTVDWGVLVEKLRKTALFQRALTLEPGEQKKLPYAVYMKNAYESACRLCHMAQKDAAPQCPDAPDGLCSPTG